LRIFIVVSGVVRAYLVVAALKATWPDFGLLSHMSAGGISSSINFVTTVAR
jgi:hypothetical protein